MKTVTNNFKEEIRKLGREIDFKIFLYANDKLITQNNNFIITQDNLNLVVEQFNQEEIEYTINADEIYNVSVVNRGELLSTMMKEVDFEVSKELKVGDVISCEFGLKVGNSYEYVNYGKYMIYEKDFNEDTKTYSYVAYDRMLLTMREIPNPSNFENKNILSVIQEICTITNLEFNGTSQTALAYPNLNKVINQGTFTDLVMTYRDMLDMICQALGLSMVVEDNELVLKDINEKERTFVGKNSLYLEDAMEGNVLSYSVDGASEQDTYSGKNLFNDNASTTSNGITTTYNNDGSISFSGTASSNWADLTTRTSCVIPAGTQLTFSIDSPKTVRVILYFDTSNTDRMIIPIGSTKVTLTTTVAHTQAKINIDNMTSGTAYSGKIYPQLEQGSTATEYEPYVGGTPSPNPDYPQEVETIPSIINLLNYETSVNGSIPTNSTSETLNSDSHAITSVWIPCKPNTTYTISGGKNRNRWQTKASDGTISYFASDSATITTNSTAKYLRCYYYYASSSIDPQSVQNVQIEEGTIIHEYIPYGYYTRVKVTGKNIFDITNVTIGRFVDPNTLNIQTTNNAWSTSTNYIPIQSNSTITISAKTPSGGTGQVELTEFNKDYQIITTTVTQGVENPTITKVLNENTKYVWFGFRNDKNMTEIQAEENTEATPYELYKENVVLIDMSKENLFDKDNANILTSYISYSGVLTSSDGVDKTIYIPCKPNTTYTISKMLQQPTSTNRFRLGTSSEIPTNGITLNNFINKPGGTTNTLQTITTGNNANYLCVFIYTSSSATTTLEEMLNSLQIFEGTSPVPYYELCSNKDKTIKDRLLVDTNGNCSITKYIGEITLNGSESWQKISTTVADRFQIDFITGDRKLLSNYFKGYDSFVSDIGAIFTNTAKNVIALNFSEYGTTTLAQFKTWLSTHNTDVYYVLATPETITLPNTQIPLFEGINHITLIDDLETDTSVVYNSSNLAVEEIDETYLNDTNVRFGKKYGPINSVVLSRSEDYDTIYRRDEESIEKNGLCEYKIKDNPILLYNDREEYIDEIFNQLKGIEYYPNDYLSKGITFLDWLDFYNVKIGDNTYKCLMLNDEIRVEQGLEESVYSEIPEETVTDYKTSSKTDKEVSFIVDKQNSRIKGAVKKDDIIASLNVAIEDGQGIVELKGNSVIIESDNYTLDAEGNMTCNNATVNGGQINLFSGTKDNPTFKITKGNNKLAKMTSSLFELKDSGLIQLGTHYNNIDNNSQLIISNGIDNIYEGRTNFFGINCRNDIGYDSLNFTRQDNQNNNSYQKSYEIRLDENEIRERMDLYNTQGTIDSYIMQRTYRENNEDKSLIRLHNTTADTYIYSTGIITPTVTQTSQKKDKKDFEKLNSGLDIIKNIDIYKYHLKGQNDEDKKHIGFVIGDNFKYSQEITSNDNDGVDIYSFVSVCCKAIQEQQEQINSLKEEIKQLKEENK